MKNIVYTKKEINSILNARDTINMIINTSGIAFSRPEHILNVYFLGRKLLKKYFNNQSLISINREGDTFVSFDVIWELISIFHDYGYCFQDVETTHYYNPNRVYQIYNCEIIPFLDKDRWFYSKSYEPIDYSNYYSFIYQNRYNHMRFSDKLNVNGNPGEICDHGILGAIKMYEFINNGSLYIQRKYSRDTLLVAFYTIAQHNIYKLTDEQLNSVSFFTNPDHFKEGVNKINSNVDFLSYLLCFIDSIEPIKKLYTINNNQEIIQDLNEVEKLLTALEIRTNYNGTVILNYSKIKKGIPSFNLEAWINNIKNMELFMTIKVEIKQDNNEVVIKLPFQ